MATFGIEEAADFLRIERVYALKLAGQGILPGAKIGKAWVFLEEDLRDYLRNEVKRQQMLRREPTQDEATPALRNRGRPRTRTLPTLPQDNTGPSELRIP
jgi:excisionase family DNA binding protein